MPQENRGLSPEQFFARVQGSNSLVEQWPFGRMKSSDVYAPQYSPTAVGLYAPDYSNALAVGTVEFAGLPWLNVRHPDTYRLYLSTEDEQEAAAWRQMGGVRVAAQVEMLPERTVAGPARFIRVTRVLGIEQPMLSPLPNGSYKNKAGARNSGYIQGTVPEGIIEGAGITRLDLGSKTTPATVIYDSGTSLYYPGGVSLHRAPQTGDEIRLRARRSSSSPSMFNQTEPVVHLLNRNASRPR